MIETLQELTALLCQRSTIGWAHTFADLLADLREAGSSGRARSDVARRVLRLYGGMGSFNDVVLQDENGVLMEQVRFAELRSLLFDQARKELG